MYTYLKKDKKNARFNTYGKPIARPSPLARALHTIVCIQWCARQCRIVAARLTAHRSQVN